MDKNRRINLTVTIILLVVFSLVMVSYAIEEPEKEYVNANGVVIPEHEFGELVNAVPEGLFVLCSIKDDECSILNKIKIDE